MNLRGGEDLSRGSSTTLKLGSDVEAKKKWVERMVKSAKKYHKICPYFDKKTLNCFIKQIKSSKVVKCDRDGKFDGCPVFNQYLEERYEWYKSTNNPLPVDFRDLTSVF